MKYQGDIERNERYIIILDNPLYSMNLGYIARIMRNFGMTELRLVRPRAALDEWSISMAMEGRPILESAQVFDSFEEALADCDITLATTRRIGKRKRGIMTPNMAGRAIQGLPDDMKIGIVFGSEDNGLSNEQVEQCTWTVTIPGASPYDSFNLSHAVALVLYPIFYYQTTLKASSRVRARAIEGFLRHARLVLEKTGFLASDDPLRAIGKLRTILYRASVTDRELGLLHAIFNHFAILGGVKEQLVSHAPSDRKVP